MNFQLLIVEWIFAGGVAAGGYRLSTDRNMTLAAGYADKILRGNSI